MRDYLVRSITQLGNAFREARKEAYLTQGELAERAVMRQATISDLEGGKGCGPSADTVFKLLAVLGLEMVIRRRSKEEFHA